MCGREWGGGVGGREHINCVKQKCFGARTHGVTKRMSFQIHYSCMISVVSEAVRLFRPLPSRLQKISNDSVISSLGTLAFSASLPICVKTSKHPTHTHTKKKFNIKTRNIYAERIVCLCSMYVYCTASVLGANCSINIQCWAIPIEPFHLFIEFKVSVQFVLFCVVFFFCSVHCCQMYVVQLCLYVYIFTSISIILALVMHFLCSSAKYFSR